MISHALDLRAAAHPERVFMWSEHEVLDYRGAHSARELLCSRLGAARGARIGLEGRTSWLVLHLLALDSLGARAYLLPPADAAAATAERLGLHAVLTAAKGLLPLGTPCRDSAAEGGVVLFTSGTTGRPKAALHTWESLAARVRVRDDLDGSRWLLTYDLSSFAGAQVLLHVLFNGGTLVTGSSQLALARLAASAGVTHVSGTPSFFRLWLGCARAEDLAALRLRQITLGGEVADDALLRVLSQRFPEARIAHVYATTELGACFSVHDGRAGFPASFLEDASLGVELSVRDGELWVRSPRAMRGYLDAPAPQEADGFMPTGDLVERRGDRVVFLGRCSERINVGGLKVHAAEVEAVMLEVRGVRAVRVERAASSLLGEIVRARVVWDGGEDEDDARRRIRRHCQARLRPHMIPRLVEFVTGIERTAGGKLSRR